MLHKDNLMLKSILLGVATTLSLGVAFDRAQPAIAQDRPVFDEEPIEFITIPEAFERGITFSSQDAYSTTATIGRQFDFLFGFAGFAEVEINRDGSIVNSIYDETMYRQYSLGPLIRTPDLPNPFSGRLQPTSGQPSASGEYWFPPLR